MKKCPIKSNSFIDKMKEWTLLYSIKPRVCVNLIWTSIRENDLIYKNVLSVKSSSNQKYEYELWLSPQVVKKGEMDVRSPHTDFSALTPHIDFEAKIIDQKTVGPLYH